MMRRKSKAAKYVAPKFSLGQLVVLSTGGRTVADGRIGLVCMMRMSQHGAYAWRYTVLVDEYMIPVGEEDMRAL